MDPSVSTPSFDSEQQQQQVNLLDIAVTNENISLNLLVQFLNIAQRRGAFTLGESSKIFECIQFFLPKPEPPLTEQAGDVGEIPLKE